MVILEKKNVLIIGGGPAGLTAALEVARTNGFHPIVIEMSSYWGGISRTVDYKGNKIDIGGHRFFSKSDVVMHWWNAILPIQNDTKNLKLTYQNQTVPLEISTNEIIDQEKVLLVRKRKSSIFYRKNFFDYPLKLSFETLRKIGFSASIKIILSYLKSVIRPIKKVKTLEDFFINRFGKYLYQTFFKAYTEKVWGVPCSEISAEWGSQRIKGLSISKTIAHFVKKSFGKKPNLNQKETETSLIEYFLYPKYGPGQMWDEVADKIRKHDGELYQKTALDKIIIENKKVTQVRVKDFQTNEIKSFAVDYCISSMPIPQLLASLSVEIPKNVKEVADGLKYRDFITVGLLLKNINHHIDDNWIYIQEPYVKVGRMQFFNNWSPSLVKDENTFWVGLEYFCNENDALWNKTEAEMIAFAVEEMVALDFINKTDFLDGVVIKMPKTYPAYFGTHNRFEEIRTFTDSIENLFLIGRNGMHKYNNQDHSMLTAMEAVKKIQNNDINKDSIWEINTEQEYHEESK